MQTIYGEWSCQSANSGVYGLNDYTAFMLQAFPKSNQSLDDLKTILLRQIEVLKSGNWDENILKAAMISSKNGLKTA